MKTETNLILTVSRKELETILKAANIEDEYMEDYVKNTILRTAMITIKKNEQEEEK